MCVFACANECELWFRMKPFEEDRLRMSVGGSVWHFACSRVSMCLHVCWCETFFMPVCGCLSPYWFKTHFSLSRVGSLVTIASHGGALSPCYSGCRVFRSHFHKDVWYSVSHSSLRFVRPIEMSAPHECYKASVKNSWQLTFVVAQEFEIRSRQQMLIIHDDCDYGTDWGNAFSYTLLLCRPFLNTTLRCPCSLLALPPPVVSCPVK